jgi:hypothetical protein
MAAVAENSSNTLANGGHVASDEITKDGTGELALHNFRLRSHQQSSS